jgi:hypothetical protein
MVYNGQDQRESRPGLQIIREKNIDIQFYVKSLRTMPHHIKIYSFVAAIQLQITQRIEALKVCKKYIL